MGREDTGSLDNTLSNKEKRMKARGGKELKHVIFPVLTHVCRLFGPVE